MKKTLVFISLIIIVSSCNIGSNNKQNRIKEALGNMTDEALEPYYESIYSPDLVELDKFGSSENMSSIDRWTTIGLLVNSSKEIKADYLNYMMNEHGSIELTKSNRSSYMETGHLGRYIIWKFKKNETKDFDEIFKNAEIVMINGTGTAQNLLVVGFFEAIQNVGGWHKVDYYKGFDKWLRPESKKAWDDLIESWEG